MMTEDDTFRTLTRPSYEEMRVKMAIFHSSKEYYGPNLMELSTEFLRKHGWGVKEYCRILGTIVD